VSADVSNLIFPQSAVINSQQDGAGEPPAPAEPLLFVDGISFSYGQMQVLFDVSLHVGSGEAVALLGTNGAGKSTLLRLICGLETPTTGVVSLAGSDITGIAAEKLARHGVVLIPGGRAIFGDMTVDENLHVQSLVVRSRKEWLQERRDVVLATFPHLAERLSQTAGSLSGGEQQQLAMARALMLEPKLLCIDELSLGLAPVVVSELLDVVRSIHASGVAVLLVEQSLNVAAHLCDRAVFMEKGQIRFEGRTVELLERNDIARAVFLGGET
jgi:ABC-type branched-subunit amino acid transport system ATPase component